MKTSVDYWTQRIYRNSFTHNGATRRVAGWSVKIQHDGIRRTLRLESSDRAAAGREAAQIYRTIRNAGWTGIASNRHETQTGISSGEDRRNDHADRFSHIFWTPFLTQRKYTHALKMGPEKELSARIEHEGSAFYFPLGSAAAAEAALKAADIFRTVTRAGWSDIKELHAREITVAVLWSSNPFACTYSTLVALPRPAAARTGASKKSYGPRVAVVESDASVGRAMSRWLSRQSSIDLNIQIVTASEAVALAAQGALALALVSRDLPDISVADLVSRIKAAHPQIAAYPYGIYEDSDHIFMSLSGVPAGYMMRRTPPGELLEPVSRALRDPAAGRRQAEEQVRHYFEGFFDLAETRQESDGGVRLTTRETEILDCLAKGCQDKQIAQTLGISAWTVHSHLKNLFEKLGVHTRTEAVLKHLHK